MALETWRSIAKTLAEERVDRTAIGAVFAWALKYNETYWAETDKREGYLKAYIDTLSEFLTARNQEKLKASISPLHLYIEFGARDRVLVVLMSLGLSRTTAIFIRNAITKDPEIDRRDCWNKLMQLPVQILNIPEICKAEVRQMQGK